MRRTPAAPSWRWMWSQTAEMAGPARLAAASRARVLGVTRRALTPCPSVFARPSLVDPFQVSKPQRSGRLEVIFEIFTQLISQEEIREGGKLTKKSLRRLKIKMAFVVLQDISSFLKLLEHLEIGCLQSHTRRR